VKVPVNIPAKVVVIQLVKDAEVHAREDAQDRHGNNN
jgi:hypothetical protein